jgi:hypothetical protein
MNIKGHTYRTVLIGTWCVLMVMWTGFAPLCAQGVAVGETNALPDPSAILDVQSVNKGMLIPRMNATQRMAIAAPANGLMVYQVANATSAGVIMPRGFWYWDGVQNLWIHLGLERTGKVDQEAGAVLDSGFGDAYIDIPEVGVNTLLWATPFNSPPTVVVTPEFDAVGTPPVITDYCQPNVIACASTLRARWIRLYSPDIDLFDNFTPPFLANQSHTNCSGAGNTTTYKYLPQTGTTFAASNTPFNSGILDLCNAPYELALWMRMWNTSNKSFRMFIDKNQDGDFNDPGEMIGSFNNLPPTGYFGAEAFAFGNWDATFYPILPIPADIVDGVTKVRIVIKQAAVMSDNPCFAGDDFTYTYDFDLEVVCGGGGAPFYPNDLNWCNVDDVTTTTARISCFDDTGTAADVKYHYKIIPHD